MEQIARIELGQPGGAGSGINHNNSELEYYAHASFRPWLEALRIHLPSKQDAALFAAMLSLPNDGRYPALDLEGQQRRQKNAGSAHRACGALLRQNPLLMIFEYVHLHLKGFEL